MELKLEQQQRLALTPQMLQSMEILQMNAQELIDYLNRLAEENPTLESAPAADAVFEAMQRRLRWLEAEPIACSRPAAEPAFTALELAAAPERGTLSRFLRDQIFRLKLEPRQERLCAYLAELLDEDGYLPREELTALEQTGLPPALLEQAVAVVQSLEPAGVGARDLRECLLLQLRRLPEDPAAERIVSEHLTDLSRKRYGVIAKATGLDRETILAAGKRIQALSPKPCAEFAADEPAVYIRPDVFVAELDGALQVIVNEYRAPRFFISRYYLSLMQETEDPETRAYLREKIRQAAWVLGCAGRRKSTLERCVSCILQRQEDFFREGGSGTLHPMTMAELAEELGLHPSTVCRAVKGKYLQCRDGLFPMQFFFTRSVGAAASSYEIKRRLLRLLQQENPLRPLSDQKLADALAAVGVPVARRTVAKYRESLGYPCAALRKTSKERGAAP